MARSSRHPREVRERAVALVVVLSGGVVREIGWGLAPVLVVVRILTRIHS
jgi:CBS-domain-containing membrane protein